MPSKISSRRTTKTGGLHVVDHPLVQHKLSILRNRTTPSKDFRELLEEIATLMAFEVTRNLSSTEVPIKTPVARTRGRIIYENKIAVVSVLRAGLGMQSGVLKLMPTARVGHIGLYRDHKTLQAVQYYQKLPQDIAQSFVILTDPMLATGHSAVKAVNLLKEAGAKDIVLMALVAAPEGVTALRRGHPDVTIYVAAVDEKLNSHGYIVPGLGDAGDRLFGTK